jgi:hypothetical protein
MADAKKSSINKKTSIYLMNVKQPERVAKRLKLTFQRMNASIQTLNSSHQVEAAVGLIDLSESGAGFFTSQLLPKGVAVEVNIMQPLVLRVRALVAWSVPIHSGVASTRYPCRSGLQFIYDNETQRQAVKEFIEKCGADPVENYRRTLTTAPSKGQGQNADGIPEVQPIADPSAVQNVLSTMATDPTATLVPGPDAAGTAAAPAPVVADVKTEAQAAAAPEAAAAPAKDPAGENNGGQSQAA